MPDGPGEQRNVYRGTPSRAWIGLQLISAGGQLRRLDLLVDTGNPCAVILDAKTIQALRWRESVSTRSNFEPLEGGWPRIVIPELDFDAKALGYANDTVVSVVRRSDPAFDGLAGLPLLRMLRYGRDAAGFWVQAPTR